jgi:DNA-directed RNA polymerase specialized sigma24 family protein
MYINSLTGSDSQTNGEVDPGPTAKTGPGRKRVKWSITPQAFDKLLGHFSPDRDEAGRKYENVQIKLLRFFEWRGVGSPDKRTDETLDRVARRIDEGQQIDSLMAYIYRVAYLVFLEALKEPEYAAIDIETDPGLTYQPELEDSERERRLHCFDLCLEGLPVESRQMIVGYYQGERHAKIEFRKQLAEGLRIPLNALRIRVHRIRMTLEKCITECLGQA